MTYTPTTWVDGVDFDTPTNPGDPQINAANLNNMEAGIVAAATFVDVEAYDPARDGTTDDNAVIAAAITAGSGGTVYFSRPGTYVNSAYITVPANTRLVATPGVVIKGKGFKPLSGCQFEGLGFLGDLASQIAIFPDDNTARNNIEVRGCTFTTYGVAIYIDRTSDSSVMTSIRVVDNHFYNCKAGVFAVCADACRVSGNSFVTAQNGAQSILWWGGKRNRITNNYIEWGTTGILFLFHRSLNGIRGQMIGNVIADNIVVDCSEEHISFDCNGNTPEDVSVFDYDTVASKASSNQITLTNAGWASAGAPYVGYYVCWNTGGNAGQISKITAQSNGTLTLDVTSDQYAAITAGDIITVGAPMAMNTITGNHVDASRRGTTDAITLYGLAYLNTIAGNTVVGKNISVRGLNGLVKASPQYTNSFGRGPCESNVVVGNTVRNGDVSLDYITFGGTDFTNHGNVVGLNTISGGSVVLEQQDVPEYTVTNVTTDRSYDANSTSDAEVADVLGTLIADLQSRGLIG